MAKVLSGSFNTTAYKNRYLTFSWTATQDTSKNQSTIEWWLKGAGSASGYYMSGNFKVVIAGETVFTDSNRRELRNGTEVAHGYKTITHNTNGSKSFSASAEAGVYTYAVNCSGSGSWDLKDIPRGATITSAPNFNDEQNPSITISNPANAKAYAAIFLEDGMTALVPYQEITGTTHQFNLSPADRQALQNATPNSNTLKVRFYVKSTIGTQNFFSYSTKTLTIINAKPTLNPEAYDIGSNSLSLTGNKDILIKNYNQVKYKINAQGKKGASIVKQSVVCDGIPMEGAEGVFLFFLGSGKFDFTVEDSRGNVNTATITKEMINYIKPSCALKVEPASADENKAWAYYDGQCFVDTFGAKENVVKLEVRWKEEGGNWTQWYVAGEMTKTQYGVNTSYYGKSYFEDADYHKSYSAQCRISDLIYTTPIETEIITVKTEPVYDWGKESFRHFTNTVFTNQKGIFGTDTEGNTLQSFLPCNANNNLVLGYGSYQNEKGNTNIYAGVDINLKPRGNITIKDNPLADFVVEEGSGGIWHWRKWNSGLAECWGVSTITTDIKASFGSGYLCSNGTSAVALAAYFPTGLFTSVNYTNTTCNVAGKILLTTGSDYTKDKMNYYIWCPNTSYTGVSVKVNFTATGRWK